MSDSEDDNPYLKKVRAGRAVASGPPPAPPDPRTERAAELLAERPTGGPRPSALADLDAADERLEAVAPASRALLRELFERCEGAVDTSGAPDCARRAADVRADAARVREILALGDPAACPDARWTYGVALVTLAAERLLFAALPHVAGGILAWALVDAFGAAAAPFYLLPLHVSHVHRQPQRRLTRAVASVYRQAADAVTPADDVDLIG